MAARRSKAVYGVESTARCRVATAEALVDTYPSTNPFISAHCIALILHQLFLEPLLPSCESGLYSLTPTRVCPRTCLSFTLTTPLVWPGTIFILYLDVSHVHTSADSPWTTDSPRGGNEKPIVTPELLKTLTSILCDGMFSFADQTTADRIVGDCLDAVNGFKEILCEIVETKFVENRTPFFWIITNLPESERKKPREERTVPPLLATLIGFFDEGLKGIVQDDVVEGLLVHSDDNLFQILLPHVPEIAPPENPSFHLRDVEGPTHDFAAADRVHEESFTMNFKIPRFYDRIVLNGEVTIRFIAMGEHHSLPDPRRQFRQLTCGVSSSGSLWVLRAAKDLVDREPREQPDGSIGVNGTDIWALELTEQHSQFIPNPGRRYRRRTVLRFHYPDGYTGPRVRRERSSLLLLQGRH